MRAAASEQNQQCYHLDTNFLIDYIDDDAQEDTNKEARQVVGYLQNPHHHFILEISEIVIGELFRIVIDKGLNQSIIHNLYQYVRQGTFHISPVLESDKPRFSACSAEIHKKETRIEVSDALIVAQSMITNDCKGLLTFDGGLIDNPVLEEIATSYAQKYFLISSDPRLRPEF